MLRTRFTDMFGLRYPVMSAPMTLHSGATLAAAVSRAGGLGSIPVSDVPGPDGLHHEVASLRVETDRPFAIGFISDLIPFAEVLFEAALASRPNLVALSFGDPSPWTGRCRDAGSGWLARSRPTPMPNGP
jgi:nitronate monooxygenase